VLTTLTGVAANLTGAAAEVAAVARGMSSAAAAAAEEMVGNIGAAATAAVAGALADPQGTLAATPAAAAAVPGRTVSAAVGLARAGVHGVEDGIELVRHPDRFLDALEVFGVEDHRSTNDLSAVTKLAFAGTPPTVWSGEPGMVKATAWSRPLPLEGIKAVGRPHGATVNDVMLAAVAGGLHRYLTERGGETDEVLWMVPVNLRPFEDNLPADLGNYFALVWLAMPLGITDPTARLREMHHRMDRIKHSDEKVITFGLQRLVSLSPGQLSYFLTNFFANKAVGVLTNVPGPQGRMRFAGVPVLQVVGFAPCSGDNPMTATILSYDGAVTVGFATDAGLVPEPAELCRLVVEELASMQEALAPVRRPARKAVRRARPARPDR
jgi:WS/DGAT/MGAT family acyltransferase